jgi:DNA polymerase-4
VSPPRVVFHLDMDAFFAAIEQRDYPELRGKPVIVGGTGRRGVVATASYEAREYGVHSAMPGYRAHQLCPNGIFLPPRGRVYTEVSRQLMEILRRYSPDVEPLSLDEAFLDMSGTEELFGPPEKTARRIMGDIEKELRLTASVGIAPNKYIAKVASDMNKPAGLTICPAGKEKEFLAPLPVERLWGVGPKTAPKLHAVGLRTIGDVSRWPEDELVRRLGKSFGAHIWRLANGIDSRNVERDHKAKSIGAERTLGHDITGVDAVRERLLPLCDKVAERVRKAGYRAGGITLKVKYADFQSITRHLLFEEPVADAQSLREGLETLYLRADLERPMRLVGLSTTHLTSGEGPVQRGLFHKTDERHEKLERAMDEVKSKFGKDAVRRADVHDVGDGAPGKDP